MVPAFRRADTIGATVAALAAEPSVGRVLVVDDGSGDGTADAARAAGASVVALGRNVGKGGAVTAGVHASPDAARYLLVDADTAATAGACAALLDVDADLVIGVLPSAAGRGGFGLVRRAAAQGIERGCGFRADAPLSGQRAIDGALLRSVLPLASRFGLEAGLTIDAVRAGASVVEVEIPVEHRHTGRTVSGFAHRGRQGLDLVRALWPRLTSARQRLVGLVVATAVVAVLLVVSGGRAVPAGRPLPRVQRVVVVSEPGLRWDEVPAGPFAVSAANVVHPGPRPSAWSAWATVGAGTKVRVPDGAGIEAAIGAQEGMHRPSRPGAFGAALLQAGKTVAVDAADPAVGLAVATTIGGARRVDPADADLLVTDRLATAPIDDRTLVLVVSPAVGGWHLQPFLVSAPGVRGGSLVSPSTRRHGLVTLSDVAPTALTALGVPVPAGMTGHAVRWRTETAHLAGFSRADRDARLRERLWLPVTATYVTVLVLLLLVVFLRWRFRGRSAWAWSEPALLGFAAYPLATYVVRAVPRVSALGAWTVALTAVVVGVIVPVARRARRSRLAPLGWIAAATLILLTVDLGTGARLQVSSPLGYTAHTAGRFTGLGNVGFAVLLGTLLVLVGAHLRHAPRRREAVAALGALAALTVLVDGWPTIGDDVGGVLTLAPTMLLVVAAVGSRLRWRTVVLAGAGTAVVVGAATVADLARSPEQRTHLGRLASDLLAGRSGAGVDVLARRIDANLATYQSPWQFLIVALAAAMLVGLVLGRWTWLLPKGSADRVVVVAILGAGLLGNALNDSGAVVTALPFVYLGPYLVLLALDRHEEQADGHHPIPIPPVPSFDRKEPSAI